MTRIFGVQRSKDSDKISIRNQMTTRVFFLRYPSLHNFLLNKLIELTNPNCNDVKFIALYSILLLLARLYPSSSDGQETDNLVLKQIYKYFKIYRLESIYFYFSYKCLFRT